MVRLGQDQHDESPSSSSSAVPPGETHSFALAADGTRLFVRTKCGDHQTGAIRAVFCDGILCDGFIWKYQWNDLAALLPLTHWHYRGHGRSAPPHDPDRIDIDAHVDDLRAVCEHANDEHADGGVVLFGHSMGCQVALEFYKQHPERVRGLVLECGSFGKLTSTFHGVPILEVMLPRLLDAVDKAPEMARAIWSRIPSETALKFAMKLKEIDPEKINPGDMLPYLQHMTHVDFPMFLRMLRAAGEHSAADVLGQVGVPTLVVAGERDTFTPSFLARSMAEAIPGADLLMVHSGTHVAPLEQPELVNAHIEKFLRERVLPR